MLTDPFLSSSITITVVCLFTLLEYFKYSKFNDSLKTRLKSEPIIHFEIGHTKTKQNHVTVCGILVCRTCRGIGISKSLEVSNRTFYPVLASERNAFKDFLALESMVTREGTWGTDNSGLTLSRIFALNQSVPRDALVDKTLFFRKNQKGKVLSSIM